MRIRQIVFAANDLQQSKALLSTVLALGTPFRDPGVAEFGIDNAVYTFGDQFIEIISPCQANTACGRHLSRHGDSGYMLLLQTDDFAREKVRWASLGVRTIWNTTFENISAAHLHPKDVGGAIVSVDEPRPATSWRWGGPEWQLPPKRTGPQRVRGITLRTPDTKTLALRWTQVFDLPAPITTDQGWRLLLEDGFVDILPGETGFGGLAGFTLAVPDPQTVLAAARSAGLPQQGEHFEVLGARIQLDPINPAD